MQYTRKVRIGADVDYRRARSSPTLFGEPGTTGTITIKKKRRAMEEEQLFELLLGRTGSLNRVRSKAREP